MNQLSEKSKGGLALFAAAGIYGTFGVLIREMGRMFTTYGQIAARLLLAVAIIVIFNALRKNIGRLSKPDLMASIATGLIFAVSAVFFTISIDQNKIANSVFLLYAGSIFTSLVLGTWVLHEKMTRARVVAIAIALVGLILYTGGSFTLTIGIITGLLAGVTDGFANFFRKKITSDNRSLIMMYQLGTSALLTTGFVLVSGGGFTHGFVESSLVVLAVFSVLIVGLNHFLQYGFKRFDVNVGIIILATELFFALVFGYIFFNEQPTAYEFWGGVCIFIASSLAFIDVGSVISRWRGKQITVVPK